MSKCIGCGINLQTEDPQKEGYVKSLYHKKCQRCFNITNYNKLEISNKTNSEFISIIKQIGNSDDLVVLVVDSLDMNKKIKDIEKFLNNYILVFTKKDLLPKYVKDHKILDYDQNKALAKIIVSSKNNYNLDLLYNLINNYKTSNKVYFVGMSNSGKSTLINKIIYNYSNIETFITTSIIPSTTLSSIEIKLNDNLTLYDTPGLLDEKSLLSKVDFKTLKKLVPNKQLKPTTLQIKKEVNILIDDLVIIKTDKINSLTFYISNDLKIKRVYKKIDTKLTKNMVSVNDDEDVVIQGLGFIKVKNKCNLEIYTLDNTLIYTRKSLI